MNIKKFVNRILKPYREIIKELTGSYTDIKITMGSSFGAYCDNPNEYEIVIPFIEDKYSSIAFNRKMSKKLKDANIKGDFSNELISFLHELGHIYTYNRWNDIKYKFFKPIIPKIQGLYICRHSKLLTNLCFHWYWNLALEKNADKWAIDYIKNNREQVEKWENKIAKNYEKLEKFLTN